MDAILAVDAGGSKSEAMLLDLDGAIIGWGRSSRPGESGRDRVANAKAIEDALTTTEFGTVHLTALGGVLPSASLARVKCRQMNLILTHEAEAALAHAELSHAVVLLAGTGAFAEAVLPDRHRRLDGAGPILGDFGGGYHLGLLAAQAALRATWHPRHQTTLYQRVLTHFDVEHPIELTFKRVFQQDRSLLASAAKMVVEEADAGDSVARTIVNTAADALAETYRDLVTVMEIEHAHYPVIGTSSLIRECTCYRDRLWQQVSGITPDSQRICLREPSVVSIGILALRRLLTDQADKAISRLKSEARQHLQGPPK